jgi:hypothetical protein
MKKHLLYAAFLLLVTSFSANAQSYDLKVDQDDVIHCDTAGLWAMPITLINTGTIQINAGDSVLASYSVFGDPWVYDYLHFSADLPIGDTVTLNFSTPYLFDQFTFYGCVFAIDYPGDVLATNDSAGFIYTFLKPPAFGGHADDTAVCFGSPAVLWMELLGNGPWFLDIVMGDDTVWGMPVDTNLLSAELTLDSTMHFILLSLTDVNGCYTFIGLGLTITIIYYPGVFLGTDTTWCAGDTLWLDAGNPGATYNWWAGPGGQTWPADTADWNGAIGPQLAWVDVDTAGCVTRDSIYIDWIICPGAVNENETEGMSIYPNPATGMITIDAGSQQSGEIRIEVRDVFGNEIISKFEFIDHKAGFQLDLSALPRGIYFIRTQSEESVSTGKLILQ